MLQMFSFLKEIRKQQCSYREAAAGGPRTPPPHPSSPLLTPPHPPTRDPWWWTLVKRHCSIEPASALHFNELMGEHGQLHTRHLLNREKAEENSFHASWLLKKPHLRRLRHMYVINSKRTLISLKEPYKVFSIPIKAFYFGPGGALCVFVYVRN